MKPKEYQAPKKQQQILCCYYPAVQRTEDTADCNKGHCTAEADYCAVRTDYSDYSNFAAGAVGCTDYIDWSNQSVVAADYTGCTGLYNQTADYYFGR